MEDTKLKKNDSILLYMDILGTYIILCLVRVLHQLEIQGQQKLSLMPSLLLLHKAKE